MKLLLASIFIFATLHTRAQDSTKHPIADSVYTECEIEPMFPGGPHAWQNFLDRNLRQVDGSGTVVVQFIVDKEAKVSDIRVISGPEGGGCREEAVRLIKKSGLWMPGIFNGRQVKAYKKVPITFP